MVDLEKFILDLVKKANISVKEGDENIIMEQIMPTLVEHLNLNLAMKVSKRDQDVMKGMLMVSPETFNGYEFFKDKFNDIDNEINELLDQFSSSFLNESK